MRRWSHLSTRLPPVVFHPDYSPPWPEKHRFPTNQTNAWNIAKFAGKRFGNNFVFTVILYFVLVGICFFFFWNSARKFLPPWKSAVFFEKKLFFLEMRDTTCVFGLAACDIFEFGELDLVTWGHGCNLWNCSWYYVVLICLTWKIGRDIEESHLGLMMICFFLRINGKLKTPRNPQITK